MFTCPTLSFINCQGYGGDIKPPCRPNLFNYRLVISRATHLPYFRPILIASYRLILEGLSSKTRSSALADRVFYLTQPPHVIRGESPKRLNMQNRYISRGFTLFL